MYLGTEYSQHRCQFCCTAGGDDDDDDDDAIACITNHNRTNTSDRRDVCGCVVCVEYCVCLPLLVKLLRHRRVSMINDDKCH